MILQKIRIMAQLETNRDISTVMGITHANNFLQTIPIEYNTARKIDVIEIESFDSNEFYNLGTDVLDVRNVRFKDSNQKYKAYELAGNTICFGTNGTFIVKIEKLPNLITLDTAEPEIDVAFHPAISKWMAYKEMARLYEEEDTSVKIKKEEAVRLIEVANTQVSRKEKRRKKIRTPRW